jgi:dTDP-4-amino-4,6-dideoxygalactose transaminase
MYSLPYGRQSISLDDVQQVVAALTSDWVTQGPAIATFEEAVAAYCDAKYAVAVNSATSALHLACLALGLQKGDWLWTVPNTFVASANCALYCGANVDFVDIDPETFNLSIPALEARPKRKTVCPRCWCLSILPDNPAIWQELQNCPNVMDLKSLKMPPMPLVDNTGDVLLDAVNIPR